MRSKVFYIATASLLTGFAVLLVYAKEMQPTESQLGTQHPDQGQKHIERDETYNQYNSSPASSGPHYADMNAPILWGAYAKEVEEEVFLHNAEHGGIIITYNSNLLPEDEIKKLHDLFTEPYEDDEFIPRKFIITPRKSNTKPIQLAAWRYTFDLDQYDEEKLKTFYLQRANKAPEALAGPSNNPINQLEGQFYAE